MEAGTRIAFTQVERERFALVLVMASAAAVVQGWLYAVEIARSNGVREWWWRGFVFNGAAAADLPVVLLLVAAVALVCGSSSGRPTAAATAVLRVAAIVGLVAAASALACIAEVARWSHHVGEVDGVAPEELGSVAAATAKAAAVLEFVPVLVVAVVCVWFVRRRLGRRQMR